MASENDSVPNEEGMALLRRAQRERLEENSKQNCPIEIFGRELIARTATELERRNRSKIPVTPERLAFKLGQVVELSAPLRHTILAAHSAPDNSGFFSTEASTNNSSGKLRKDGKTLEKAKRKVNQAKALFAKAQRYLDAPEVVLFAGKQDKDLEDLVHSIVKEAEESLLRPWATEHGHPAASMIIEMLHNVFANLTETRLRSGATRQNAPDEFIIELLAEFASKLVHNTIAEGELRATAHTSIKKKIKK